jgi:class 3 adenylate cyclase
MASLDTRQRARLPDSAFAYIDSRGRRLLPIHDEAHVRNALARFSRITFDDESARDRARMRLIKAARKQGIVPLGFVAGQLEPHRKLPTGAVTFLMSDIESSTALLSRLGDGYAPLLASVRRLLRTHVRRVGGHEVDARADEFFAAFSLPAAAIRAAIGAHQAIASHAWADGLAVRLRMGIHSGRPSLTSGGYVGLSVHAVARICRVAQSGQIVVSRAAVQSLGESIEDGIELLSMGEHRLRGLPQALELFEVSAARPPEALGRW